MLDDIGFSQRGIVKPEVVTVAVAAGEIILQRHLIVTAISLDDEIITLATEDDVFGFRADKTQGVGLRIIGCVIAHGVATMPCVENIGVAEETATFEGVVTGTAFKRIATRLAT